MTGKNYQSPERYFRRYFGWCCLNVKGFHDEQSFHQCLPIIEKMFEEIHQLKISLRVGRYRNGELFLSYQNGEYFFIKMTNFSDIKIANFFYQNGEFRSTLTLKMANFSF